MANAKHYVNNNQETDRTRINEVVDERTQWELYMPPFIGAIEAGVQSFMCSYNLINGKHACENDATLGNLREKLNFTGFVMSDWFATHSTAASIKAGLDQEMPGGLHFDKLLVDEALATGAIDVAMLNRR
jgi:beta-glucosidase